MTLAVSSDSFARGAEIPRRHGYKNDNSSPPLKITGIPDGTKSLALIMDDPDAMGAVGKVWVHWLVWNIRPFDAQFAEGAVPAGTVEGTTDFDSAGYGGPAPPDKEHTYIFRAYALDDAPDLPAGSRRDKLDKAIRGHVIEEATLEGRYAP